MMDRDALPHSACHKEHCLIFSVPHAVLDDKMATAAIFTVMIWEPDSRSFIYCFCVAQSAAQPSPTTVGEENTHSPSAAEVHWIPYAAA